MFLSENISFKYGTNTKDSGTEMFPLRSSFLFTSPSTGALIQPHNDKNGNLV